jgi:hypothetical protein
VGQDSVGREELGRRAREAEEAARAAERRAADAQLHADIAAQTGSQSGEEWRADLTGGDEVMRAMTGATPHGETEESVDDYARSREYTEKDRQSGLRKEAERARTEATAARAKADELRRLASGESGILDEIDSTNASLGVAGLAPEGGAVLTGGMLEALKKPENMIRLAGIGLGVIGILLLMQGLRAEAGVTPPGPSASPSSAATAIGTPITQATPLSGTTTANASFVKVSGPCNLAARFTDRFSLAVTGGALTLTQLSNNHVSRGEMSPTGEFSTSGDGQGYRGKVTGMTAEGQHTYTAQGCNEVYGFTMQLAGPLLAGATAASNRAPEAGAIQAQQVGTSTVYSLQFVRDQDGEALRYAWTSTNPCGSYSGATTPVFTWSHPHPPCPDEAVHPGTIAVTIDDGRLSIQRQYTRGSVAGTGGVPLAGVGISTIAPSPTATPIPTSTAPSGTPTNAATGVVAGSTGPNVPLALAGGLLTLGGLGLVFGGPLIFGGPRIRRDTPADPCEREKREELAARARRDAARRRLDRINELRAANDRARADLERADRENANANDDRHVSWGEDVETGRRIYTNKDQKGRIDRARAGLDTARAAADAARTAYEGAGNGSEATAAQESFATTNREWERAYSALQRCLQLNAPPPPPTPPTPPATPGGQPPVTTSPGGPVVATPPSGGTQTRRCPEGTERSRADAATRTRTVAFPDLRGAKLKFSSDTRQVTDFPIDDFIDWAQFTKDSFFAIKKVVGLSAGVGPNAEIPVEGALDVVNFPDFLTYYDEMIDKTLKALKEAAEQQRLVAKNGEYWLEYKLQRYELRCEPIERCVNGEWTPGGRFSLVRSGEPETRSTARQQALGDVSNIERESRRAIDACFRELERANGQAERDSRQFQGECR